MRQFGSGAGSLGSSTPIELDVAVCNQVTNGIKGEVAIAIDCQKYYLWRAVDSEGNVLDISNAEQSQHAHRRSSFSGNC